MTKVFKVAITKSMVSSMQDNEINLLVRAGDSLNQIILLYKCIRFSSNNVGKTDIELKGNTMQSQIFTRILVGVISETLKYLGHSSVQRLINDKYKALLRTEGQDFYAKLKKRFGTSKLITSIRNGYAFHSPNIEDTTRGLSKLDDDADISIYAHEDLTNSMWWFSEQIIESGILSLVGKSSDDKSFKALIDEVVQIANEMNGFLSSLIAVILVAHFGPNFLTNIPTIDVSPDEHAEHFHIPFYFNYSND